MPAGFGLALLLQIGLLKVILWPLQSKNVKLSPSIAEGKLSE
jgi:hypothetical protein